MAISTRQTVEVHKHLVIGCWFCKTQIHNVDSYFEP